ncbi:unnamed protein product [Phaedon cochleariae]|uniref:Uncharacterized protein n=1 Tax=Phaedon cochleariae TaxID=80249 RepID=A0A9N9SG40_PHACE|nr:unnamed protein product [Phaedon cochleariae]
MEELPAVYCGASENHIHYDNFVLKEGEPMKPFMRDEVDEKCTWLDVKKCSGYIDSSTFTLFPCVEYITIDECIIQNCSPKAFEQLAKLKALDIRNSEFPVKKNIFEGAKNVESLSISNFHFKDNDDIFSNLSGLLSLTLENCTFGVIEKDMFSGLHTLKYLSINESKIDKISSDCFNDLENLEELGIRDNKIDEFDPKGILKLINLKRLSLHNNETSSEINYEIFQQLPALESFLFDNIIYESLDFSGFKTLKNVEIGFSKEKDDNTSKTAIFEKLKSMNIEYQFVFCGKVSFDKNNKDVMVCC